MTPLYYLVLCVLFFCILYTFLYIRQYRNPLRTVPGPSINFKLFLGTLENYTKKDFRFFSFCQQERRTYGSVRSFPWPIGNIGLAISDPKWIKYILITNGSNFINGQFLGSGFFKQAVGEDGLVVVNGEQHKRYKKQLSPAFKLSTLKTSMPILELGGQRMVNLFNDYWRRNKINSGQNAGSALIDMKHLFNKATLDVAVMFLLGYDLQESCSWKRETFGYYLWNCLDMQDNVFTLFAIFDIKSSVIRQFHRFNRYLPNGGFWQSRMTNKMHDMIENVIEIQIKNLTTQHKSNVDVIDKISFKPLLDYMLDSTTGIKLSRQEIHDLIMTFIIGGHETASVTLTFILYEICRKSEYQTRLRKEVIDGFKELGDKVTWDDISKKFPFLNACAKESLRMYPPVPWLPRTSVKPDTIDGHYVPADTLVLAMTSEMHRNSDIWPDPNEFKPERFLEPDDTIPWDCWLPFGDGFHKCVGYQFGMMEVTYLLAIMIKNFRFSVDTNIDYKEFVFISLNTKPTIELYVNPL